MSLQPPSVVETFCSSRMSAPGLGCVKTPELNLRTKFRVDFNQFEKQKRWRRLPEQYEHNSARFSCAHVFAQPGSFAPILACPRP